MAGILLSMPHGNREGLSVFVSLKAPPTPDRRARCVGRSAGTARQGRDDMDLGISDRVAVVTGGDSGMGYETAACLLREGVRVVLSDIDESRLQNAAEALSAFGSVMTMGD